MGAFKKAIGLTLVLLLGMSIFFPPDGGCITIKEEEELSREMMKYILKRFKLVDDPYVVEYVRSVGNRILEGVPDKPFEYEFFVVQQKVYNAFAIPGGKIFINSGLITAMQTEEELAGILSHEISHVVCRHISRKIKRQKKLTLASLAGMAAGILLGGAGAGALGQAVLVGSMAGAQSAALAYSRDDEMQADQIGLKYLARAGYDGTGLPVILNKMRHKRWYNTEQIPTYLMTHPALEERIAYITDWIESRKSSKPKAAVSPNHRFLKARVRLLAFYEDESISARILKAELKQNPEDPMRLYGYGLVMSKTGNRPSAIEHLQRALNQNPFDKDIIRDLGRVYFLDGQYQEAYEALQGAVSSDPDDAEARFYLGRTQLEIGQYEEAKKTFVKIVEENEAPLKKAYFFLSKVCGKLRELDDAHYYLGFYYKEIGKKEKAEMQLRRALDYIDDPERKKEIEKMIADMKKKEAPPEKEEKEGDPKGKPKEEKSG
jgi:predicted Zn-dependent protease